MDLSFETPPRVLVVDADEAVRALLARELAAAGYEVDTLSSGDGFSEDMVRLIRPDLLLVDPLLDGVPQAALARALASLREDGACKLVLIDGGGGGRAIERVAAACRPAGIIAMRDLLDSPGDVIAEQLLPEAEVVSEAAPLPTADAAAEEGIDIDLTFDPPAPRPPPAAPPPPGIPRSGKQARVAGIPPVGPPAPAVARRRSAVLERIHDEVGTLAPAPVRPISSFRVEVTLFGKHNFYVGASGDLATGGVFVATDRPPPVGQRVRLRIELSGGAAIETDAPVEWVREAGSASWASAGAGLSLAHLEGAPRRRVEAFFAQRMPLRRQG